MNALHVMLNVKIVVKQPTIVLLVPIQEKVNQIVLAQQDLSMMA